MPQNKFWRFEISSMNVWTLLCLLTTIQNFIDETKLLSKLSLNFSYISPQICSHLCLFATVLKCWKSLWLHPQEFSLDTATHQMIVEEFQTSDFLYKKFLFCKSFFQIFLKIFFNIGVFQVLCPAKTIS